MPSYDKDYFKRIEEAETIQAKSLSEIVIKKYKPKKIADIGCATGLYLVPFHEAGVKTVGYDNAKYAVDKALVPTVKDVDITKKMRKIRADVAICIEVLEHIEDKYSDQVIDNIAAVTDTVIFTAAQVGQGGTGHVNCQPREYWENKFKVRGFNRDVEAEEEIREYVTRKKHEDWFKNNLQVFIKHT